MKILLKFLLKNIKEKKLRSVLIWFSITLSTALFLATLAIPGTIEKVFIEQFTKYTGSSEIIIQVNPQSDQNPFFDRVEHDHDDIDYSVGVVESHGVYEDHERNINKVFIGGYTIESLNTVHNITTNKTDGFNDFKAIIGKGEAEAFNLNEGDEIELLINGVNHQFTIYDIVDEKGLFNYDGEMMSVVIPTETLATIFDHGGQINRIYVKTTDENISDVRDELSVIYNDYMVTSAVSTSAIEGSMSVITASFSLMLVLVIFISIFIIYTSFKVISMERLQVIGTFRSIGATRKMTDLILLGESILYGIIGGISGCFLGFGILKVMVVGINSAFQGSTIELNLAISLDQIIIAFLGAVILSVISAIIPIIKVSKIPVRDIVLNNVREFTKRSSLRLTISILLLIIPLGLMLLQGDSASTGIAVLSMISIGVGIVMIVPFVTRLFGIIFEKINTYLFGNEGAIAAKNLRDNKNITNNITLLTIGIASLLMINVASSSVTDAVSGMFDDSKFELALVHPKGNDVFIAEIESLEEVDSAYGVYVANSTKLKEQNDYVTSLWGMDAEFFDFWDLDIVSDDPDQTITEFMSGRHVILPLMMQNKYNLEIGDEITFEFYNTEATYTVKGFVNTMMNNGDFILLPNQYLKEDADIDYKQEIYVKTNDSDAFTDIIDQDYAGDNVSYFSMSKLKEDNIKTNDQVFSMLLAFSIITMVIGIFGIFNNYVVSFISRRKSLAMYRSVGMSKRQTIKMLLIESFTGGVIGGVTGVTGGLIFTLVMSYIMKAINIPLEMHLTPGIFIAGFLSGIILSLLSSLLPAMRSSKREIIEALKYE